VTQANAALAQAQAALDVAAIEAPFGGTVTDLQLDPGDTATVGAPLVTLATLDRLQVETTNLTEIDVVNVVVGQVAHVSLDATPNAVFDGQVVSVQPQGYDYLGDVIYTAVIEADLPTWARWGMTVQIAIGRSDTLAQPSDNGDGATAADAGGDAPSVIAEGAFEPVRWSTLQFVEGGQVAELLVGVGDSVSQGDLLVRLDATSAALALREAEASVRKAEAELALVEAGAPAGEIEAAEANVRVLQGGLQRAIALRDQLLAGADAEVAGGGAQVAAAEAAYRQALITAGNTGDQDTLKQLALLQLRVRAAEERAAALPVVEAARLRAADAGVRAAQAQLQSAQTEVELLKAPPRTEEIAAAEAKVAQAEDRAAEAQVSLARTKMRAPFSGTVTQVLTELGESVSSGQPVMILADLEHQRITTVDLTELDVAGLTEGQPVRVTVDALPGETYDGHIVRIKSQSVDYRGDVAYPLIIELDQPVPRARWGMRAAVEIPRP
jgi:HlyD family secretion protein